MGKERRAARVDITQLPHSIHDFWTVIVLFIVHEVQVAVIVQPRQATVIPGPGSTGRGGSDDQNCRHHRGHEERFSSFSDPISHNSFQIPFCSEQPKQVEFSDKNDHILSQSCQPQTPCRKHISRRAQRQIIIADLSPSFYAWRGDLEARVQLCFRTMAVIHIRALPRKRVRYVARGYS